MPERGLRFHVFDKDSGALVVSSVADAAFAFHHVNAYEEGSDLVIDVITYDDAGIIDELYLSHLRAGETVNATGRLTRCIVSLDSAEPIEVVPLADEMIELPRIDYDRCAGRPYRYVWGVGRTSGGDFLDSIVRIDVASRAARTWYAEGCYPGEPVFVAEPGAERGGRGRAAVGRSRCAARHLVPAGARCTFACRNRPRRVPAPHPLQLPWQLLRGIGVAGCDIPARVDIDTNASGGGE